MPDKQDRISFLSALRITWEGYKITRRISPRYLPCMLGSSLITAVQPLATLFFSARIINELLGAKDVLTLAIYVGVALLFALTTTFLNAYLSRVISVESDSSAVPNVWLTMAEKYARMDYAYTEDGELQKRLSDIHNKMIGNGRGLTALFYDSPGVFQGLFGVLASLLLLSGMFVSREAYTQTFITSGWATLALAGLIALGLFLTALYQRQENKVMNEVLSLNTKGNTTAWYYGNYIEPEVAAKEVRLYQQQNALLKVFREAFDTKTWFRLFCFHGQETGFSAAMLALVGGAAYVLIGLRAMAGMYEIGNVLQYVGAVTTLATTLGAFLFNFNRLLNNAEQLKPILDFLDLPQLVASGTRPVPENAGEAVFEFKNVSFRYPGTETDVLSHLNLRLMPGKRLAVVGLNGSGKTTMIKLLCRLYDPTEGEILMDGVNIQEYDLDSYRRIFSVVFQDFALFPQPLDENVAVSSTPDAECAKDCLDAAGFSSRMETLDRGPHTMLYKSYDKEGVKLSGGEEQKVALARALYKRAPVFVLDEPTAALDPLAEFEVYSTFEKTIGGHTAVFISHRLSSCRFCDDIAVFEKGTLKMQGPHETLLQDEQGLYYALWTAQAQHYQDEEKQIS